MRAPSGTSAMAASRSGKIFFFIQARMCWMVRGYCKPRCSGLRSGANRFALSRGPEPLGDSGAAEECAGVSSSQIVLQQRAQVGFVVDVHLQPRVATLMNLRAGSVAFGSVFCEAARTEV